MINIREKFCWMASDKTVAGFCARRNGSHLLLWRSASDFNENKTMLAPIWIAAEKTRGRKGQSESTQWLLSKHDQTDNKALISCCSAFLEITPLYGQLLWWSKETSSGEIIHSCSHRLISTPDGQWWMRFLDDVEVYWASEVRGEKGRGEEKEADGWLSRGCVNGSSDSYFKHVLCLIILMADIQTLLFCCTRLGFTIKLRLRVTKLLFYIFTQQQSIFYRSSELNCTQSGDRDAAAHHLHFEW